jgi:hypothetical protein
MGAQCGEPRVDRVGFARAHQEADAVTAQAAGFGGLVGFVIRVEREVQGFGLAGLGRAGGGHGVLDAAFTSRRAS